MLRFQAYNLFGSTDCRTHAVLHNKHSDLLYRFLHENIKDVIFQWPSDYPKMKRLKGINKKQYLEMIEFAIKKITENRTMLPVVEIM